MKKTLIVLLILTAGCNEYEVEKRKAKLAALEASRHIPYQEFQVGSEVFSIVTIEGHRYLTRYAGGFTHVESCECRRKQ